MNNEISLLDMWEKIKPGSDSSDPVSMLVVDWYFSSRIPHIDRVWVVDDGIYYPIIGDCIVCLLRETFQAAFENNQTLGVCDSTRMFLLSLINYKTDGRFPDELFFSSAAALLSWIIEDSGHDEDGEIDV